jgi:hypothetical protein
VTSTVEAPLERQLDTIARLLVTVRDQDSGSYRPVGFLSQTLSGYRFGYLRAELERRDFRPLPGLSRAVAAPVESASLFPVFAERVIASRRPDRQESLAALGLTIEAAPFEVLVRTHGHRVGDTIELLPAPDVAPGQPVSFTFLTHGVRHLPQENQARITALLRGQMLRLRIDHTNAVNARARLVTDEEDIELGWVPDPLLDVIERVSETRLTVERANGPEVGYHFRLLVRLDGVLPVNSGRLFDGPGWETAGMSTLDLQP